MSLKLKALVGALVWSASLHAGGLAPCEQEADNRTGPKTGICQDSQGGTYSPGSVVEVGGKVMECVVGPHWAPVASGAEPAGDVLDVGETNLLAGFESTTLAALNKRPLPALACDTVLNATQATAELIRVPAGEKRLVMFWTPTCGPCKPLLSDLAALARRRVSGLSVLGIVEAADAELEPPGEWALLRVKQLMTQYDVGFPTCVHRSREQMKLWHAEGVPLILVLTHDGVERVAAGRNGQRLVAELTGSRAK